MKTELEHRIEARLLKAWAQDGIATIYTPSIAETLNYDRALATTVTKFSGVRVAHDWGEIAARHGRRSWCVLQTYGVDPRTAMPAQGSWWKPCDRIGFHLTLRIGGRGTRALQAAAVSLGAERRVTSVHTALTKTNSQTWQAATQAEWALINDLLNLVRSPLGRPHFQWSYKP